MMTNWESVVVTISYELCYFCFTEAGMGTFLDRYRTYLDSVSLYKETNHIIYYMIILSAALARRGW